MKKYLITILLFLGISLAAQEANDLKLWYKTPSNSVWENALPIGNGFMGAMVYGDVEKEVFQLNEGTLWSGSPNRNDNPKAKDALSEIRKLIFQGEYKKAEQLTNENIISKKSQGQMFQPVGNLQLDFSNHQNYINYYRELDIEKAVTKTVYTVDGITYTREAFMSFPDRVLVIKLSADKPGKLSFKASFNSEHKKQLITLLNSNELSLSGTSSDHEGVEGKVNFNALARFKVIGGNIKAVDNSIQIDKADSVLIFVSIATNFINYNDISGQEKEIAKFFLDKAFDKNYDKMKKAHLEYYQKYFKRVQLDLGRTEASKLPTDERLANFRNTADPSFVTLYYQYGRYLLISSSQPGGQTANLQGIWNHSMNPAWDSKYTININTEMNYWPAEKTNLSEMHEPLLKMIRELADTGKETAKVMYGARGWMVHHNTDIWRINGAVDGATWGVWNAGGGWLSQHLWEHYLYNGDKKYLESVYEVLKGAADFYSDFLVKDPANGWLVVAPGNSPENAPQAHQGSTITAGSTMDNQIVFDVFSTVIRASEILGKDKEYGDSLKVLRKMLPPMQIGKYNQIQEWLDDIDDPKDNHRHISHLYGLYPSNQISAYRTPELFAAAKNTLLQRGDVSTGWSMGWKVNWWAKMQDGNHAYSLIQNQLTPLGVNKDGGGTYNNLFDAHPPFQIDGNFGCTSGITEMLLQSSDGAVHLLPALPDALKEYGEITGLKARGGFEIMDMKWEKGKLIAVNIKSNLGGNLRLRTGNKIIAKDPKNFKTASGENGNPFYQLNETAKPLISKESNIKALTIPQTYLYDVKTEKGKIYTFLIDSN
ncbi:alpha-L-fucosidase 2 [Flavobacterium sp. 90]|uniref:glycoside hydrolase family 95 protein n=1 Tax=unclassified Flavobacterium TaxID=196869 RepID=UPI000EB5B487|nr:MULTISPECIES: glycoside hydrolase family 95 protein [unclassified Flavobacterium]RKR09034.1 alpha-L-fucosidase 2 [Flavobacterium sp. 81]TCK52821.1 alpha-L-fucosidase 2 [Flavobacterium sp. 90]